MNQLAVFEKLLDSTVEWLKDGINKKGSVHAVSYDQDNRSFRFLVLPEKGGKFESVPAADCSLVALRV